MINSEDIRFLVPIVAAAFSFQREIEPSLKTATVETVAAVIAYCMVFGLTDPDDIYEFLEDRGVSYDHRVIAFVFGVFEGDDPEQHLWRIGGSGLFEPVVRYDLGQYGKDRHRFG
jgi:hypothetical protein